MHMHTDADTHTHRDVHAYLNTHKHTRKDKPTEWYDKAPGFKTHGMQITVLMPADTHTNTQSHAPPRRI